MGFIKATNKSSLWGPLCEVLLWIDMTVFVISLLADLAAFRCQVNLSNSSQLCVCCSQDTFPKTWYFS